MRHDGLALDCLSLLFFRNLFRTCGDGRHRRNALCLAEIAIACIVEPDSFRLFLAVTDIDHLAFPKRHIRMIVFFLLPADAVPADAQRIRRAHEEELHHFGIGRPHRQARPHIRLIRAFTFAPFSLRR